MRPGDAEYRNYTSRAQDVGMHVLVQPTDSRYQYVEYNIPIAWQLLFQWVPNCVVAWDEAA